MTFLSIKLEEVKCKKCGGPLGKSYEAFITKGELIKCEFCGTVYKPTQTISIFPRLVFEKGNDAFEFQLNESVMVGREPEHNYIIIELLRGRMENTYIRNPYVSRKHIEIRITDEYLLEKTTNGVDIIYAAKKCLLKDLGSSFKTAVNNSIVEPNEERTLRHNDIITLSPRSPIPVTIIFKEKIQN